MWGPCFFLHATDELLFECLALPLSLIQIASTAHLNISVRQSALLVLKRYVQHCWSDGFEEFTGPLASDGIKDRLRDPLLGLVTDEQRKIRLAASSIVSKIAGAGRFTLGLYLRVEVN